MKTFMLLTTSRWILLRMRNVPNESCRQNQSIAFMSNTVFAKIVFLWDIWKMWWRQRGRRQYGALRTGLVRLHARKHNSTPSNTAPTHTELCNTYCFFTVTVVSQTRLYVTLYVGLHCLFCYSLFIYVLIHVFFKWNYGPTAAKGGSSISLLEGQIQWP
jgi:hypothetical protein